MATKFSTRWTTALVVVTLIVGALAVGAFASSHVPEESNTQSVTYLRVAHTSPDAPAIDVYLDNETFVTNASFGDVSEYQKVVPGEYNLTITEAGDEEAVVFEANVTLEPRVPTTVAASGEFAAMTPNTFGLSTFTDNALAPGENSSAIRLIHLSPDAPAVTLTADNGSTVLAENVSSGNASDYVMVPAGNFTVEVREATDGANGTVIKTMNLSLASGQANSAWLMGYEVGLEPLMVETTQDATLTIELPDAETPAGNETATPTGNETATPAGNETATPTGNETATPTGNETATPTGNETATPTDNETETET